MRRGFRHAHELEVGARFQVPGSERVERVVRTGTGMCYVRGERASEDVSFTTLSGETVEFTRQRARERPVAPTMMVVPVLEGDR